MNNWCEMKWYPDREMNWTIGYNLKHWLFGFSFFWHGFFIAIGPFFIDYSDAPF